MRYIFILCLLIGLKANAQNLKIDSLQNILNTAKGDTNKISLSNKLAFAYAAVNDSANTFSYSQNAILLSKKINYKYGIAKALATQATFYANKIQPQKAVILFEQSQKIFEEINDFLEAAGINNNIGRAYVMAQQAKLALPYFDKAEVVFEKQKHTDGIIALNNNRGAGYVDLGEKEKAIACYIKALQAAESANKLQDIAYCHNNIGKLFTEIKNYDEAKKYLQKAIASTDKLADFSTKGKAELNLGNVYVTQNDYTTGIQFYKDAKVSFEKANFKRGIIACYNNIGAINIRQGNYQEAITYLQKSIALGKESNITAGLALTEQNIGYAYTLDKKYDEALKWMKQAEVSSQKNADKFTLGEIYTHRATLDSAMGNYESALQYKSKYQAVSEQLLNDKITRQVNELQTKYETEKKQHQIEVLDKDNSIKGLEIKNQKLEINKNLYQLSQNQLQLSQANLEIANNQLELKTQTEIILEQRLDSTQKAKNILALTEQSKIQQLQLTNEKLENQRKTIFLFITAGLLVLGGLLGYSYYRRYKLQQQAKLQTEILKQQELATKGIVEAEENERKRIAGDLHDGVGQMMSAAKMNLSAMEAEIPFANDNQRKVYEKVLTLVDESCKEVRSVSHNMMPNALLKSGLASAIREFINQIDTRVIKIDLYTEGLNEKLDSNVETVLYRVVQECVNNVIKHAGANHLDISLIKDKDGIAATIEDNGKGFDASDKNKFEGIGLKNIKTRIEYLKGNVEWNSTIGNGTVVAIHVPITS
jgi:two-component system, NarL family, sensor kinase